MCLFDFLIIEIFAVKNWCLGDTNLVLNAESGGKAHLVCYVHFPLFFHKIHYLIVYKILSANHYVFLIFSLYF